MFNWLKIAAYKDEHGKSWVLPVVRTVELQMASDVTLDHEYLPVLGIPDFCTASVKLILGVDSPAVVNNLVNIYFRTIWFSDNK